MLRRYWALMLMPLSFFGWHDPDEKETFESLLNMIVRASRERLRPLKTFRIEKRPSNDYWYEVTDVLPGSECRIYEHPRMVYVCTWTASSKEGPADVQALVREIDKALPGKWTADESKGVTTLTPAERRYPVMEISGDRKSKAGMQIRIYAVARD